MSSNRSVQAAQRRRAGPPDMPAPGSAVRERGRQPPPPTRSLPPPPSNNPNFSSPNPNPNYPYSTNTNAMASATATAAANPLGKMTALQQLIATLFGKVAVLETKLLQGEEEGTNRSGGEDLDTELLQNIVQRLEALEKKTSASTSSASTNNSIMDDMKKWKELHADQLKQTKNALIKENMVLKASLDTLSREWNEFKDEREREKKEKEKEQGQEEQGQEEEEEEEIKLSVTTLSMLE